MGSPIFIQWTMTKLDASRDRKKNRNSRMARKWIATASCDIERIARYYQKMKIESFGSKSK